MNNIFGNSPVYGDDFFGRESFVKHIKGIVLEKNSFLLLGLRRTGKSSALQEVKHQIQSEKTDVIVVDINCQTYESIQEFYKHIYLGLPSEWRSKLRVALKTAQRIPTNLIDYITDHVDTLNIKDTFSVKFRKEVITYSRPLEEEITRFFKQQDAQIILLIDELPFLFENIDSQKTETTKIEIEAILSTLRSWREIGVSQAICGSLNLHIQLESFDISKKLLGGITTQNLPKYTDDEAKGLITKLAKKGKIKFNEENLNTIIDLMPDKIPQFLQQFYFCLHMHWNGDQEDIISIYNKHVYPVIINDFEYQFQERFSKLPEEHIEIAENMLNKILKNPKISETQLLKTAKSKRAYSVLFTLYNQEFIIIDEEQSVDFSFEIVRNWWKKKHK